MTVRLRVSDLIYKHGFGDGDLVDDHLDDMGFNCVTEVPYNDETRHLGQVVLEELVRRHIAPLVPEISIHYDVNQLHNPVRVRDQGDHALQYDARFVDISMEEIRAIASAVVASTKHDPAHCDRCRVEALEIGAETDCETCPKRPSK